MKKAPMTVKYEERFLFEEVVVLSIAHKLGVKTATGTMAIAKMLKEKAGFIYVA